MNKLDKMYKKVLHDMKIREQREWFIKVSSKAVPAYFELMYRTTITAGKECPESEY